MNINIIGALLFWIPVSVGFGYLLERYETISKLIKELIDFNFEENMRSQKKTRSADTDKVQ